MNLHILATIRTNNFTSTDLTKQFEQLWQQALTYPLDKNQALYCLYYDFDSNYQGDYSAAIATPQAIGQTFTLPEQQYQIYEVQSDVFKTWQAIWQDEENGRIERRYLTDYELYRPDGSIFIYIGIK